MAQHAPASTHPARPIGGGAAPNPDGPRTGPSRTGFALGVVAAVVTVAVLAACGSADESPPTAETATATPTASAPAQPDPELVLEPADLPGHPDLVWRVAPDLPLGQWCLDRLEPQASPSAGQVFTNPEDGQISERVWTFPDQAGATAALDGVRTGLAAVADGCAKLLDSTYEVTGIGDEALLGEYVVADPDPEQDRVVTVQAARTGLVVTVVAQEGLAYDYGLGPVDDQLLRTAVQRHCASSGGACVADQPSAVRTYPQD